MTLLVFEINSSLSVNEIRNLLPTSIQFICIYRSFIRQSHNSTQQPTCSDRMPFDNSIRVSKLQANYDTLLMLTNNHYLNQTK